MLQSFVIQRVLDGEKAERSESARQLQEVEKKLAGQPMGKQREALAAKKAALAEEIKKQSAQVSEGYDKQTVGVTAGGVWQSQEGSTSPVPSDTVSAAGPQSFPSNDRVVPAVMQILETQQQLMRAKAEEDLKGQAAADAKRWNGLKTIVEARSLLKSVFKVAASQKAQVGCVSEPCRLLDYLCLFIDRE